ncbi:MAG: hypothetical protein ABSD75_34165 [Terriglobales bacterium]
MKARALVAWGIVFLAPALWAGESVLYSVTEQSVAYPATNRPVAVSVAEDKTDVFAIDPETGKKRLVFSDANAEFMIMPGGRTPPGIVAAGRRIFSVAVDRQAWANGRQSMMAVYELSTDGSGKARKVFEVDNFSNLFVSPSGSKIGYFIDGTVEAYMIRGTATGKLLRTVRIQSGTIYGEVSAVAWAPDGERILFSLGLSGDGDDTFWNNPDSPVGTYVMREDDAAAPTRLAPEAELHYRAPGKELDISEGATLIGVLPDGQYLLSDSTTPLYTLDLVKKTQRSIPANEFLGTMTSLGSSSRLSPSGRQLALTTTQNKYEKQSKPTVTSTVSLWALELESGKPSKLLSFAIPDTTRDFKGPWINLIGWLQD